MEDKNYTLLPEAAWSLLVSWYGLSVGSRSIVKNVEEHGVHKKLRVEVYLIELKMCVHPNSINIKTYSFSRGDLISDIVTVMKQQFKISDTTECRIWERDFTGKYDLLTDFQQTVSDAGIHGGQMLMLEKKNPDETWPRDKTK
ncbi:PREDICTED: ubiquitin carboxyl-terminal hydrolase 4-like [Amphimedon queenslandica]|uniref:Ubiquitin-like domain-containing protein n=1 Tax=Amphimedon queenslandica TaxID=400682 RepID=A0AAN0JET5_AMPQE|nr:PREDICTED: ubiquitin carboxyl-terminal hydrolase 4-like [Amphimedon queenslandica]|eukprot:XP_019855281.1 PREDICTED: ubiquitin carboxyl-terminal hydrolase 4-like [Amphimedon queenslandica]